MSTATRTAWAKSHPLGARDIEAWSPLWRHLQDSAAVAGRLWDVWLPPIVRERLARDAGGDEGGRALAQFLAGVHDIGKLTPAFASQVATLRDAMHLAGLRFEADITPDERHGLRHGLAGDVILRRWLTERYGWDRAEVRRLSAIVGGHHGVPPGVIEVRAAQARWNRETALHGGPAWTASQDELLDHMANLTGADAYLGSDSWHRISATSQVLLASLVVLSDWLASDSDLFPLVPVTQTRPLAQPDDEDTARLESAWARVQLPTPWSAIDDGSDADALLRAGFELPARATARPVQQAVVEAARRMDAPGLLIVEAPMGEGKTEAALLAAQVLAARTGAGGIFVALPTQATSDAMFARLLAWQERVPSAEAAAVADTAGGIFQDDGARHAVALIHGKAWLNPDFAAIPRRRPGTDGADVEHDAPRDGAGRTRKRAASSGAAYVDAWFRGRKAILADFSVGTIDQVLMAALQSRHVALRHLGLARKVVVLDEVHAFSAYMNAYLERALEWLGAYGVPVVALSATLPSHLRQRLIDAYRRGSSGAKAPGLGAPPNTTNERPGAHLPSTVVTYPEDGAVRSRPVDGARGSVTVRVERADDDLATLERIVADATLDGGCVLVVRNTVGRAQDTYDMLAGRFGDDVELFHSRFLALDRKAREARLLREFGRPRTDGQRGERPRRRIVVATQVVEQSLDVDFDLLVTDLAPTDLLLQRIGRLHRHERPADHRPAGLREPRVVVLGADWAADPPELPRGSVLVYGRHLLLRAAAQVLAVSERRGAIELPVDIADLVDEAYGQDALGPASWAAAMREARARADGTDLTDASRAGAYALAAPGRTRDLTGWLDGGVGEAEDAKGRAQVRDADDSVEVLIVQTDTAGQWSLPGWIDSSLLPPSVEPGELLPRDSLPREPALRALAGCSVRLPAWLPRTPDGRDASGDLIAALEALVVEPWQDHPRLAGELVLPLDAAGCASVAGIDFRYDRATGLRVSRHE